MRYELSGAADESTPTYTYTLSSYTIGAGSAVKHVWTIGLSAIPVRMNRNRPATNPHTVLVPLFMVCISFTCLLFIFGISYFDFGTIEYQSSFYRSPHPSTPRHPSSPPHTWEEKRVRGSLG